MLRVEDLHHSRRQRASVNHESYKQLLHKLYARIRHRASMDFTEVSYTVPPLIPGRPIYSQAHAARYMTEKLQKGGFSVKVAADVMHVSWPPAKAKKPKKKSSSKTTTRKKRTEQSTTTTTTGKSMSERLRELSERLRKL